VQPLLVAVSPVAVYRAMPLASVRMGPNLVLVTFITVGLVAADPMLAGAVLAGAVVADEAASGWVPGGWVAVDEWPDVPPPQAASNNAPLANRSRPGALARRWCPA
jgi:hypothetical protein